MKLTKSYLRKIIKEELRHILLEFDKVADDETQHIGGGDSKSDPGTFDYDKGEDEVYEEADDGWEGPGKMVPHQEGYGSSHYRGPGDDEDSGPSRGALAKRERELEAEKRRETSAKDKRGAQRKRIGQAWKDQVAKNEGRQRTKRKLK